MNHTNVTPHLGSTVRHKATGLEGLVSWLEDAQNHRTAPSQDPTGGRGCYRRLAPA